jgi:hypothetical protein
MKLSLAERRWMLSFLIVNGVFWIYLFTVLINNPDEIFEVINLLPVFFYEPFSLLTLFPPSFIGGIHLFGSSYPITVVLTPLIGILCHLIIGYAIGHWSKNDSPQWITTLLVAFITVFILSFGTFQIVINTGVFS